MIIGSVVVSIIMLELMLEFFNYPMELDRTFHIAINKQDTDITSSYELFPILRESYSLFWENVPNQKGIDERGFRTSPSNDLSKAKIKVLVLGDSVPFGDEFETDINFPSKLSEFSNQKIFIYNLSTVAYSSYQGVLTLKKWIDILRPDLVIESSFYNNDEDTDSCFTDQQLHSWLHVPSEEQKTKLGILLVKAYRNILYSNKQFAAFENCKKVSRVSKEDFKNNILLMRDISRSHNSKFLYIHTTFSNYPKTENRNRYFEFHKGIKEFIDINKITAIQLDEALPTYIGNQKRFLLDHCHLTALGHEMMAWKVLNTIKKEFAEKLN